MTDNPNKNGAIGGKDFTDSPGRTRKTPRRPTKDVPISKPNTLRQRVTTYSPRANDGDTTNHYDWRRQLRQMKTQQKIEQRSGMDSIKSTNTKTRMVRRRDRLVTIIRLWLLTLLPLIAGGGRSEHRASQQQLNNAMQIEWKKVSIILLYLLLRILWSEIKGEENKLDKQKESQGLMPQSEMKQQTKDPPTRRQNKEKKATPMATIKRNTKTKRREKQDQSITGMTKPNTSRTAKTQTQRISLRVTRADARITQDRQARKQRRADKITLQVEQLLDSHLAHSGRPPDHVE